MTTKELLAKAKAVGGWYVNKSGRIRTKNRLTASGEECCPVAAVLGVENDEAVDAKGIRTSHAITVAADYPVGAQSYFSDGLLARRIKLRKEMESWCK